jgi:pimeloyl-ACP methyl ester carboxylesterase
MKILKRILITLLVILLLATGGFLYWALNPLPAMPEALSALNADEQVKVTQSPWLTFTPLEKQPASGVILYPGGHVDPRSYAPPARQIAAAGYLVVIPPMPLNLAVFAPNRAEEIIAAYPGIEHWVIGGHSLGGAMAANYAFNHPQVVNGLLLWASYPAQSNPLNDFHLPVLSIYGTMDMGLAGILASQELLPQQTQWVVIEGGNHAQFGWYGIQPGDGEASISRQAQQEQILEATLQFLATLTP